MRWKRSAGSASRAHPSASSGGFAAPPSALSTPPLCVRFILAPANPVISHRGNELLSTHPDDDPTLDTEKEPPDSR